MKMMLMGWNMEQWAYVAGWYQATLAPLPEARLEGACDLKAAWDERYMHGPLSQNIYMPGRPRMNFTWAKEMMLHVAKDCAYYSMVASS